MKRIRYIFLVFSLLINCKPAEVISDCENTNLRFLVNENYLEGDNYDYDALILNEGGYTYGNASISAWNINGVHDQNVFKAINNYDIGDILQSGYKTESEIYLIVNNSQKIEVLDINNLKRKRTITGFTSPRYMTTISNIALVTDLYANKINVFNTETNCEYSSIEMQGWTEQIFNINDRIYVIERSEVGSSSKFANIVEIELSTNLETVVFSIVKRTNIPIEPNSVVVDGFNNIWILSTGNEVDNIYPSLTKFSTNTNTIEKTKNYTSFSDFPKVLCNNNNLTDVNLFYSNGQKIYSLAENSSSSDFNTTELFTHAAQNLYKLSYVPANQTFLLCDAKDYISEGAVLSYSFTGNLIESFTAGVIPGFIVYK